MKKLLILFLSLLLFNGCEYAETIDGEEVIIVDSCEYIRTYVYGGYVLTHKGNCKNHGNN